MNELIVSARAESEMDDIWLYVARASQNVETANRAIDTVAARFGLLARYPALGRAREDLGPGIRSFAADGYLIVYEYRQSEVVRILHILARGRDLAVLYAR